MKCGRRRWREERNFGGITGVAGPRCGSSGLISCKCRDLNPTNKDALLNLLAVEFAERDAPAGTVTLPLGRRRHSSRMSNAWRPTRDLGEVFSAMACPDHFAADTKMA